MKQMESSLVYCSDERGPAGDISNEAIEEWFQNYRDELYRHAPTGQLISNGFEPDGLGLSNIKSARVIAVGTGHMFPPGDASLVGLKLFDNRPYKEKQTTVTVDITYKNVLADSNGTRTWTVSLSKETKNAPWRIDGMGTG